MLSVQYKNATKTKTLYTQNKTNKQKRMTLAATWWCCQFIFDEKVVDKSPLNHHGMISGTLHRYKKYG